MDRDMLIQYVDILNKMEDLPYDVRMSHNDLDYSIIHFVEESALTDEELSNLIVLLKSLNSEERMSYIKDYLNQQEKESAENSEEQKISDLFGVNIRDIQHLFLENGNEIFAFYDSHSGNDIVLGNLKKGKSLMEQLESIQQENEKYRSEDEEENAHSILLDEATRNHLALPFYTREEISSHSEEIDNLTEKDKRKLKYMLAHYDELNIVGINISNMIYLDQKGEIHEAVLDAQNHVQIAKPASLNHYNSQSESESVSVNQDSNENDELSEMMDDSYSLHESEYEKNQEKNTNEKEKNKVKVYVKKDNHSDENYGFTNNAFYFFLILFGLLFLIFVFLFIFVL